MKTLKIKSTNLFSHKEQGVTLFISLILLMVLTIIGLSAAQRSTLQERMAGNTHLQNVVFNAAESAIGGFLAEANVGDSTVNTHVLDILRQNSLINDQCYNELGVRVACDGTFLDGDKAKAVTSKMSARVLDNCNVIKCQGFSVSEGVGTIGCRVFEVDATGTAGAATSNHIFTAYEVTTCI